MITGSSPPGASSVQSYNRVAVTGASGFVGQHFVHRLRAAGVAVLELSRSQGFNVCVDQIPMEGLDRVFHFAGLTGVPKAWGQPLEFFETNALGTMRVLDQCRLAGCAVTYLSAYVYGSPERLPISEDHPVAANNPYAFSKHVAEEACDFYARHYGLSCITLRLFNTYGPGQNADFLVPFIAEQLLDKGRAIIEVKDLAPRRDYVYIDDVVDAIVAASNAPSGSVFNIGSGVAYSVEEIIHAAIAAAGIDKPYRSSNQRRKNEIDCVVADISALQAAVGWEPRTSLKAGLRKIIESLARP